MKIKKEKKEVRSLSPGYVNLLINTQLSPQTVKKVKKIDVNTSKSKKVTGVFNSSKLSMSSRGSIHRSRNNNHLPLISGGDLRTIKEVFIKAKENKIKQSQQRIPTKRLPKSNIIVDKRPRVRSIPKPKKSSTTLAPLSYYIYNNTKIMSEYPKDESIPQHSTPSKHSSTSVRERNHEISKFYSNYMIESCPQLPQIANKNLDSSSKKDVTNHSPKYQVRVIIDKFGNEKSCITRQRIHCKKKHKTDTSKKSKKCRHKFEFHWNLCTH